MPIIFYCFNLGWGLLHTGGFEKLISFQNHQVFKATWQHVPGGPYRTENACEQGGSPRHSAPPPPNTTLAFVFVKQPLRPEQSIQTDALIAQSEFCYFK
jgi:hypothetical protein